MARLKCATRTQHETVERLVDVDKLSASPALYRCWLRRLYGFYAPLETRLALLPWAEAGLDFDSRRKTALLARDLASFGEFDPGQPGPYCRRLPELATLAHGLGCLYVLEGATLGGRIIARRLYSRLLISEQRGGRFYHCYGRRSGAMWRRFASAANAYAASHPDSEAATIDAACKTFYCFEQWLGTASDQSSVS